MKPSSRFAPLRDTEGVAVRGDPAAARNADQGIARSSGCRSMPHSLLRETLIKALRNALYAIIVPARFPEDVPS
jgi:hypothetical protein